MTTVVLVTGGASGIGAAVVRRFARDGARVVIADIDETGGQAIATEVGGLFVPTDVTTERDNQAAVDAALRTFGRLDVVHLNAGIGGAGEDFDLDHYRRVLAVNIDGTMFGFHAALPVLAGSGGGAVVATSSIAGIAPARFDPTYAATKHAVIGLVRSLAMVWAESAITINAVCPGFVATPMLKGSADRLRAHGFAVAEPDEVAAAVQSIVHDGGTGQAWTVQANQAPTRVDFPTVELSQTG